MLRKLLLAFCFIVGACTTIRALKSPSENYHRYVDRHLKVERIFDRGRELLIAKVLPVTETFKDEHEKLTPVKSIRFKDKVRQVIMALNVTGREPMFLANWELRLGGRKAIAFDEIRDDEVIENEYYFAYPFYRVFVVDFPLPPPAQEAPQELLEVLSPYGKLAVKADFAAEPPKVEVKTEVR